MSISPKNSVNLQVRQKGPGVFFFFIFPIMYAVPPTEKHSTWEEGWKIPQGFGVNLGPANPFSYITEFSSVNHLENWGLLTSHVPVPGCFFAQAALRSMAASGAFSQSRRFDEICLVLTKSKKEILFQWYRLEFSYYPWAVARAAQRRGWHVFHQYLHQVSAGCSVEMDTWYHLTSRKFHLTFKAPAVPNSSTQDIEGSPIKIRL